MTYDDFDQFFDLDQAAAPYEEFPPVITATEDPVCSGQDALQRSHDQ